MEISGDLQNGIVRLNPLFKKPLHLKCTNQRDETIPVDIRVTKQQRDELQRWASYFASQERIESIDPNTNKETVIIERSQIGSMALRRENPNYSNYDIREIIMKDCIEIWQNATIRDALPDEYKENLR